MDGYVGGHWTAQDLETLKVILIFLAGFWMGTHAPRRK